MVIHYLDLSRPGIYPNEADTPLVVDPDAVLANPVALQRFQAVARRRTQVSQFGGSVEHQQLAGSDVENCIPSSGRTRFEQLAGLFASEAQDQD